MPRPRFACLALVALWAQPAAAKELWRYDWVEVRSPHFTIASALDEERSVELTVDLENFRHAAELLTNIGRFEERIPTKIYVLPRPDRHLGFDGKIAGFFMAAMRANYAVAVAQGSASDEIIKHEYVHFLVHNRDARLYPTWFDEGFAELLATLKVEDGVLEYGKPAPWRVSWLVNGSWLPFKSLLAVRSTQDLGRDRGAMFYAQSWLLMHYLMIGRGGPRFTEQNSEYLALSEAGVSAPEAFERAFGLDPSRLQTRLLRYAGKLRYFRMTLKTPFPAVTTATRPMRPDEIAADLGVISITQGNLAGARKLFGAALAANGSNALALVGTGDLHKQEGRWDEAVASYERAIALEPAVANHELDYGEYFLTRASRSEDGEERRELLTEARRHFARSYKLDPNNPETLDQNGLTYLFEGEDPAMGVESLELANQLVPGQADILLDLARAYLAAGQPQQAQRPLAKLLAWGHSEASEELMKLVAEAGPLAQQPAEPPGEAPEATEGGGATTE